jgi:hypothetical protein
VTHTYPRGTLCFRGKHIPITDIQITGPAPVRKRMEPFTVHLEWITPAAGEAVLEFFKHMHFLWWDNLPPEERERLDLEHLRVQFDAWCDWVDRQLRFWRSARRVWTRHRDLFRALAEGDSNG